MVQPYHNRSGKSGVTGYELRDRSIVVWFGNGRGYEYDAAQPGPEQVSRMQELALAGRGLATYISREVRGAYARKVRC